MASRFRFHFVLHDHQPFGNFPEVFEKGWRQAYGPALEALERHPSLRFGLHVTGALWHWIEDNRPAAMETVGRMVQRGQVELIGGPFYEPILALVSRRDALGQFAAMRDYLEKRFGVSPRGAWLAERVWQPDLPEVFAEAGVAYTMVDDNHLLTAGPETPDPAGYYLTESRGDRVALFPIDHQLRYCIPFQAPEETLRRLEFLAEAGFTSATYADDGEKFGLWPETEAWVWGQGWFEKFLQSLEKAEWVETALPAETLSATRAAGLAFPPTTSYEELGEWALPPSRQIERHQVLAALDDNGTRERARPFLRGGHFTVFLARYPESNALHKRMLGVSRHLAAAEERAGRHFPEVREALYRAQVNCPYWHGLFGGLYLPALRTVIPVELLRAERRLADLGFPPPPWLLEDLDCDGYPELLGGTGPGRFLISGRYGGGLREWSRWDLDDAPLDVVARRREAYHENTTLPEAGGTVVSGKPLSIHDIPSALPPELARRAGWDEAPRVSGVEILVPGDFNPALAVAGGEWRERSFHPFQIAPAGERAWRLVPEAPGPFPGLERVVRFSEDGLSARFDHRVAGPPGPWAVEWNLACPAGGQVLGDGRPLFSINHHPGEAFQGGPFRELVVLRGPGQARLRMTADRPVGLTGFVLETLLRSESGFEAVVQGVVLMLMVPPSAGELGLDVMLEAPVS